MRSHLFQAASGVIILASSLACAAAAGAAQPLPNGVEVTSADRAHLMSLRGAMPKNDEFSKSPIEHAARPLPWIDGDKPRLGDCRSSVADRCDLLGFTPDILPSCQRDQHFGQRHRGAAGQPGASPAKPNDVR